MSQEVCTAYQGLLEPEPSKKVSTSSLNQQRHCPPHIMWSNCRPDFKEIAHRLKNYDKEVEEEVPEKQKKEKEGGLDSLSSKFRAFFTK